MFVIKAIVLAGGTAERLKPVIINTAKPLIDVAGKPMINHIMEKMRSLSLKEVYVSTNEKFKEDFEKWLSENDYPAKLVIEKMPDGKKLGAIAGLAFVIEKENIDEDCLIIAGDNLFGFDLQDLVSFFNEKNGPVVSVHELEEGEDPSRFGIVSVNEENKITEFQEKPDNPKSRLTANACYLFPKETLMMIKEYLNEGNSKDSPGHFLEWLIKKKDVHAFKFDSYFFDVGTPESLKKAREFMEKN